MANLNKNKGDQYERDVLAVARRSGFPFAERTRPGRREDQGDIHLCPGFTIQCKDVATLQWRAWLDQLAAQKKAAGMPHGALVVKRRGAGGRKPLHLAVMSLDDLLALLVDAGWGDADTIPADPAPRACFVCDSTRPAPAVCGPQCHITDADNELAERYAREGDHQ